MSFFEEEPPGSESNRPQRSSPGGDQTVLVRRLIAIGAGVLILILLILGVRGCLGAREDSAVKGYVNKVGDLMRESDSIDQQFFGSLAKPSKGTALDLANQVNTFRAGAEQLVERGNKLDHPGDLGDAQRALIETLQFRANALTGIAKEVPAAFAQSGRQQAFDRIAGQMQLFLASDVVFSQLFTPDVLSVLDKRSLTDEVKVPQSRSSPDLAWLDPNEIAQRLGSVSGGKAVASGSHGTGLVGVTAQPSGTQLDEAGATTIPTSPKLSFEVQIQNQGDNDESDVTVSLKLSGSSPVNVDKKVSAIAAGDTATVTIPLGTTPAKGAATLNVAVAPVPGEKVTDNNKATYQLVFGG